MSTNLLTWLGGSSMQQLIYTVGTLVVLVVPLALAFVLIAWVRRRMMRRRAVHPIGRHMLPGELPGGNERILLVDDDPVALQVHSGMLSELGYQCHTVASGEAAVVFVQSNTVDLLLLDLVMDPGINGVETLRQVKKIRPNVRAILVSGYAKPSDVAAAQSMGAGAYLIKPVATGMLATEVRRELDERKKK